PLKKLCSVSSSVQRRDRGWHLSPSLQHRREAVSIRLNRVKPGEYQQSTTKYTEKIACAQIACPENLLLVIVPCAQHTLSLVLSTTCRAPTDVASGPGLLKRRVINTPSFEIEGGLKLNPRHTSVGSNTTQHVCLAISKEIFGAKARR
ncbi:unnamed protein product, partial [Ectocarpus fasciculatus]